MSIFTLSSKIPIEKSYDVVSVTLEHRRYPVSKIQIKALVTNEITGSDIRPSKSKEIIKNDKLRNLTLADSLNCKELILLLIGIDYYYNPIAGKIMHLNKNLVAVENIFGWCLQSRKSVNDTTLTLNIIVEENLISDYAKIFYNLEAFELMDEKKDLDFIEN